MADSNRNIIIDLLRHGEPEGGDVLRGRLDHALSPLGWSQMHKAMARARQTQAAADYTHIITSPLQRCRAFAESLASELQLQPAIVTDWQEIDYGEWDGLPLAEWRRVSAAQFAAFRADMAQLAPPNGEDFPSFSGRVLAAWQQLAELPDDSHVLVVTHGGVLRVVLPTVLGMPLNRSQPLQIPFASFSRVALRVRNGQAQSSLVFHNAAD